MRAKTDSAPFGERSRFDLV